MQRLLSLGLSLIGYFIFSILHTNGRYLLLPFLCTFKISYSPILNGCSELYSMSRYCLASFSCLIRKPSGMSCLLTRRTGAVNSKDEKFHFVKAYILSDPKNIYEAISKRGVVMDLCIDQPASDFGKKAPHDRGPHIRISVKKLQLLFDSVEQIL